MSHPAVVEERRIQQVARRPGGWAVLVVGGCTPIFVPDAALEHPPAAGDLLRTLADGSRVVVRT
jgi:hypothetical protein